MSEEYKDKPSLYKALRGLISGEEFVNPYRFGETSFAQNPKRFIDRSDPNYQESIYAEPTELPSMDSGGMAGSVANVMKGPGWQSRTLDWLAGRLGKAPKSATIESWVSKLKGSGLPEAERKTLEPILNDFNPKDIVSGNELAFMAERVHGLPTLGIETKELSEAAASRYDASYRKLLDAKLKLESKARLYKDAVDDEAYQIGFDDALKAGKSEGDAKYFAQKRVPSNTELELYDPDYGKLVGTRDRITDIQRKLNEKFESASPRWKQYNLDEVKDKREVLYKQRGSTYTNADIESHYPDETGTGLQWHQREGKLNFPEGQSTHLTEQQSDLMSEWVAAQKMKKDFGKLGDLPGDEARIPAPKLGDNWYKTGFRDLVNRAVKEDSKFISWDSAAIQKKRWPAGEGTDKFFDSHYDQKLVNFVKKEYGVVPEKVEISKPLKQYKVVWATERYGEPVTHTEIFEGRRNAEYFIDNFEEAVQNTQRGQNVVIRPGISEVGGGKGTEVWRIPITDDIKRKVLFEGQYFSKRKPEDEFSRPYDMA